MRVATAWQAMDQNPVRFLVSAWPWRALLYLLSGVLVGVTGALVLVALLAGGVVLLVVVVGAVLLGLLALAGIPMARLERWRLRLVDLDATPDPHRAPLDPGVRGWLATRLRERATWRELGFSVLSASALCWLDLTILGLAFALPFELFLSAALDAEAWSSAVLGVVVLATWPYLVTCWAGARAALTRTILAPRDAELGADLVDVGESRRRLVDAFDTERARIERDLHDGAQQRLVSMSMSLGLARLDAAEGSEQAAHLDTAAEQVHVAQAELRDLVRGVNPPTLRDHGLEAALEDSAGRSPVPMTVDVTLPHRLPDSVETTAYFVFTEAMANIAKHSHATSAHLFGRHRADTLILEITDNGVGGADPRTGSGLTGLADRVAIVDGRLRLSSPPGGPSLLRAEIPCRFA